MKKLIFCILFMMMGNFVFAVVNTHTPGTPEWHNYNNNMLGAQMEYDRQRRERAAQQQQQVQPQQQLDNYIKWSVFVWDDETGEAYYYPCEEEKEGWFAKRAIIKRAQKIFTQIYGKKPNRYIDWECGFAVITMGIGKKSGKIEAFVDTDLKGWVEKYDVDDPNFKAKIDQAALDYCSTQADNCELIYGVGDFGQVKK